MQVLLRNSNTVAKHKTKKDAAINHPLIAASFGSLTLFIASERHWLELAAGLVLIDRALHAVTIVNVPALELVQQCFVANVQATGRLLAIPARLFQNS